MIRIRTPGVAVAIHEQGIDVSFESGSFLPFGFANERPLTLGGKYLLLAQGRDEPGSHVMYGGKTFSVFVERGDVHLLVDLKDIQKLKKESRTVPGRRLR